MRELEELWLPACGSTNDEAAKMARDGAPAGSFVVADRQTAGRGRRGRTWSSPPGGLYMSVVTRPVLEDHERHRVALAAGVAVADMLSAYGARCCLKWPNDVLVHGKKMAGVLTEVVPGAVIVGVGVNVSDVLLPGHGIALEHVTRETPKISELARPIAFLVDNWARKCEASGFGEVLRKWRAYMLEDIKVSVQMPDGEVEAYQHGLLDDGSLEARLDDGTRHKITCGDVQVLANL